MSFQMLLQEIEILGASQGMYGRLYDKIMSLDDDELEMLANEWNGKFNDIVDFILYYECCRFYSLL